MVRLNQVKLDLSRMSSNKLYYFVRIIQPLPYMTPHQRTLLKCCAPCCRVPLTRPPLLPLPLWSPTPWTQPQQRCGTRQCACRQLPPPHTTAITGWRHYSTPEMVSRQHPGNCTLYLDRASAFQFLSTLIQLCNVMTDIESFLKNNKFVLEL